MNQAVYESLFYEKRMTDDSEIMYYMMRDRIAQKYGWRLEYIDNLGVKDMAVIEAIMSGEGRYARFKRVQLKHRQSRGRL